MNTKVEHKSGPKMKMQESDELILEEPKKTETKPEDGDGRVESQKPIGGDVAAETPKAEKFPMDTAYLDGRVMVLYSDKGAQAEGKWHRTRTYDAKELKWVEGGFWRHCLTGAHLPFTPVAWSKYQ